MGESLSRHTEVLSAPARPVSLPPDAVWLAGEGAGSWFVLRSGDLDGVEVRRYSPEGKLECEGIFVAAILPDLSLPYELDYPCHCQVVTVLQNESRIRLVREGR